MANIRNGHLYRASPEIPPDRHRFSKTFDDTSRKRLSSQTFPSQIVNESPESPYCNYNGYVAYSFDWKECPGCLRPYYILKRHNAPRGDNRYKSILLLSTREALVPFSYKGQSYSFDVVHWPEADPSGRLYRAHTHLLLPPSFADSQGIGPGQKKRRQNLRKRARQHLVMLDNTKIIYPVYHPIAVGATALTAIFLVLLLLWLLLG